MENRAFKVMSFFATNTLLLLSCFVGTASQYITFGFVSAIVPSHDHLIVVDLGVSRIIM